jgi:ABC-type antimicrobial peptide transport system permease subunit
MLIREIEKALTAKGYELVETDNLVDDFTKLLARKNSFDNLPVIDNSKKETTLYELNRTNRANYYFQNNDNIFQIQENIITGFEIVKNDKLRKVNKTIYKVLLNGENYTLKNFKVFLGII